MKAGSLARTSQIVNTFQAPRHASAKLATNLLRKLRMVQSFFKLWRKEVETYPNSPFWENSYHLPSNSVLSVAGWSTTYQNVEWGCRKDKHNHRQNWSHQVRRQGVPVPGRYMEFLEETGTYEYLDP